MTVLRPHEAEVVRLLARGQLPTDVLEDVIAAASFVDLREPGSGYFLTVKHPRLPSRRVVCSEPLVSGQAGDVTCGFVLFLQNGLLTLECHSWGDASIPEGFRARDVAVSIAT
jgi:hypothetical protein